MSGIYIKQYSFKADRIEKLMKTESEYFEIHINLLSKLFSSSTK
jgi:hypothetical protein